MIEVIILNHLKDVLGVPVYMEEPITPPVQYVLMEKTGSDRENMINSSTFAFQSYDGTLYLTAMLNERVKAAVESLAELDEIGRVTLNSDYNFTDVTKKRHRYQAVYDIKHY